MESSTFRQRLGWFAPLFIVIFTADQLSKAWAVKNLAGRPARLFLNGIFKLTYAENRGAWGSMGANWNEHLRWFVLVLLPCLLLLGLAVYMLSRELSRYEVSAYTLVLAGGLGNQLDRIRLDYVVDFLYLGYGRIGTNIFNIADMVLLSGIFMLIFRRDPSPDESPTEASFSEEAGTN